ncbi:cation:proton antiporter [Massilia sp. TS11]|nr:cation:proton antiporter [Massilia sp. TS11]
MIYLGVGYALGPGVLDIVHPDPVRDAAAYVHWAEAGLLLSLFGAGLKLGVPLRDRRWLVPLALAFPSLAWSVAWIGALAHYAVGLSWGAAIVLGAILAPTDPVLAAGVRAEAGDDPDPVRFALTAEGALNDGAAYPFVMLGLALLAAPPSPHWAWYWLWHDLLWATLAGAALGAVFGAVLGMLIVHLRTRRGSALGLEEFLVLGLISLTYGATSVCQASPFLAVFAAGLALQRVRERPLPGTVRLGRARAAQADAPAQRAVHSHHASAALTEAVLGFNGQLETLAELGLVVLLGALLPRAPWRLGVAWGFAALVFVLVRPLALLLTPGLGAARGAARPLLAWFGIRGIGSLYYLLYVAPLAPVPALARQWADFTLITVAASVLLHGLSVHPMMAWYGRRRRPPAA